MNFRDSSRAARKRRVLIIPRDPERIPMSIWRACRRRKGVVPRAPRKKNLRSEEKGVLNFFPTIKRKRRYTGNAQSAMMKNLAIIVKELNAAKLCFCFFLRWSKTLPFRIIFLQR